MMRVQMEVNEAQDDGRICIPSKILLEYLKNLPEQPITFTINEKDLSIEMASSVGKYRIGGEKADDFPKEPAPGDATTFSMPSIALIECINKTLFAVSTDTLRPAMTGVYFELATDSMNFVSTDAHRLVQFRRNDVNCPQVMNGKLKLQRRKVKLGDYVRIGLPGPDNEDRAGYDWVEVKTLKFSSGKRKEQCVLTMMPCPVPGGDNRTTAHFFSGESSSTFLLTRDSRLVTAEYYGHNEVPNTATSGIGETVRNLTVASGAILGLSDMLWEPLTKGLLMDGTTLRDLQAQTVNS
ncbi:DNA polymerase III beta subunit, central domain protein [Ostertagia ostertagi]